MPDNHFLLRVDELVAGYGKKQVLNGVSLHASCGEIVALIGHNGAGKSTLLKSVFGLLPIWGGTMSLDGVTLMSPTPREMRDAGVAFVPQGNRVFRDLTVSENLEVAGMGSGSRREVKGRIERILGLFPMLSTRLPQRAGTLSGGEKQVLALASALMLPPRLLLADEPSLGLAPRLVAEALARFQELNRNHRMTILIVEQKVRDVLKIAHRVYILQTGKVSFMGPTSALDDAKLREIYF